MKKIIIVGDNNYWYSTGSFENEEQISQELNSVKELIKQGAYSDGYLHPNELFIYEITDVKSYPLY